MNQCRDQVLATCSPASRASCMTFTSANELDSLSPLFATATFHVGFHTVAFYLSLFPVWWWETSFLETFSAVSPQKIISLMHWKFSGAPCFSKAVWISQWQIIGLCFHLWGNQFEVYWISLSQEWINLEKKWSSKVKTIQNNPILISN